MQTSKTKTSSLDVDPRKSPMKPQTSRQLNGRKSPQNPSSEKKRPNRVLESQVAQLQEELNKAKDQLNSSELWKRRAQQEAEEAKKQVLALSMKLEESEQQYQELSASDDDRVRELRKISHERDRAWQSELEALLKQHSLDSAALVSSMNEIKKLNHQIEMVTESAKTEINGLKMELEETFALVEKLKADINHGKESEAQALEAARKSQIELEKANARIELVRSDGAMALNSLSLELEQSKERVKELEQLLSKKLEDHSKAINIVKESGENEKIHGVKAELDSMRSEVNQLKSALDEAEKRYKEEYIQSTLQIRSAYEQVECTKLESLKKEEELAKAKAQIEELKAHVTGKGESELAEELMKSESDMVDLKASLLYKETELQSVIEENEVLKLEIEKRESEKINNVNDKAYDEREMETLVTENSEMEAEMRRLKVQLDQWRKAAEAATSMLSNGEDGKLDSNFPFGSFYPEDLDDESLKKKNVNMLKKIGVLWRKAQK